MAAVRKNPFLGLLAVFALAFVFAQAEVVYADGIGAFRREASRSAGGGGGGTDDQTLAEVLTEGNSANDGQQILGDPDADPFYSFVGDPDTGVRSSSANNLELVAGSATSKVWLDDSTTHMAWDGIRFQSPTLAGFIEFGGGEAIWLSAGGGRNLLLSQAIGIKMETSKAVAWASGDTDSAITHQFRKNASGDIELAGSGANTYEDLWTNQQFTKVSGAAFISRWLRAGSAETLHAGNWQHAWSQTDDRVDGSSTLDIAIGRHGEADLFVGDSRSTVVGGDFGTVIGHNSTLETGLTGASVTATGLVPANVILLGVTTRVQTAITGATTYDVGDGVDVDLYGAAIGIAKGSESNQADATAASANLRATTAAENVVLTANGANFTGGDVRITVHYLEILSPQSDEAGAAH